MLREIKAKAILQKSKLPASPYCLNPYVGCSHNCCYCYARFMRRFTKHSEPWGGFVDAKINAPEVLARQLERAPVNGPVLLGSVCDAYQPIEKHYKITRRCIKELVVHKISFSVLTKSCLVLRDLDILSQSGNVVTVGISMSTLDDSIRQKFEPGASSVQDRLNTLKELHANGIRTYVFIGPILPLITDPKAIVEAVGPFVDEVWGEALNTRCGNRGDLVRTYKACKLSDEWQSLVRSEDYWSDMAHMIKKACHKANCDLIGFYRH